MKKVVEFLQENFHTYMATVEDGNPRIRPFDFMYAEGERFYFCTGNHKEVYKQMKANPNVELSVMSKKMEWLRVRGKVVFVDDIKIKEKIMEVSPIVKKIYKTPDNPTLESFYISEWEAVIADLSGKPPREYKASKLSK